MVGGNLPPDGKLDISIGSSIVSLGIGFCALEPEGGGEVFGVGRHVRLLEIKVGSGVGEVA